MRLTSVLILGCAFHISAFLPVVTKAQAWRNGVLIMSTGDSLKGQIEFSDPDMSTRDVRFRSSKESGVITYDTDQVTSFRIENPFQRFDKLETRITYYSNGVVRSGASPIIGIRPIVVFAEVIRSGPTIILYSLFDEDREERFFVRKNGELTELVNVSYLMERDARTYTVKDERYHGQLRALLLDCPAALKQDYNYDGRSMGKAVDKYMSCKGELISAGTEQKRRYEQVYFGLLAMTVYASNIEQVLTIGGSIQVLSRKNRGNQFLWLTVGGPVSEANLLPVYVGLFAGTYIGSGRIQPLVNVGVTSLSGTFNSGVGVAFNKRVILCANVAKAFEGGVLTANLTVFPRLRPK